MPLPTDFQFSQASLQDYVDCPRRFYLRYVLRVDWPALEAEPVLEHERRLRAGQTFHAMVHQHLVGVPVERLSPLVGDDSELARWWEHYLEARPADVPGRHYPELTLTAPIVGYRLIAKYDLVVVNPEGRAIILDWKTNRKRWSRRGLGERLQTRVYRYLLARAGGTVGRPATADKDGRPATADKDERPATADKTGGPVTADKSGISVTADKAGRSATTSGIPPDRVEMVYWFAEFPHDAERFVYDPTTYVADGEYLTALVAEIRARSAEEAFALTDEERACRFCPYRSLCDRGQAAGTLEEAGVDFEGEPLDDFDLDFDQIAEIEF